MGKKRKRKNSSARHNTALEQDRTQFQRGNKKRFKKNGSQASNDRGSSQFGKKQNSKFLTPRHGQSFRKCMSEVYPDFVVDPVNALPSRLHDQVSESLNRMEENRIFHYDIVATNQSVSSTFVRRTLIGKAGMTYHYQKLRIFAFPWEDEYTLEKDDHDDDEIPRCGSEGDFRVIRLLSEALQKRSKFHLQGERKRLGTKDSVGSADFNVCLINYMDSENDQNEHVPLKMENKYGMGKVSVSWHADSSLQDQSTIAVYHQTGDSATDDWRIALRSSIRDDVDAVALPLANRQAYYMLNHFNRTHHHAVLTGQSFRYSCTFRVGVVAKDTYQYIHTRCQTALKLLEKMMKSCKQAQQILEELDQNSSSMTKQEVAQRQIHCQLLRSFGLDSSSLRQVGEVHTEVEFEWIRMFWLQGQLHAQRHCHYWMPCIRLLTKFWRKYELCTRDLLACLREASRCTWPRLAEGSQLIPESKTSSTENVASTYIRVRSFDMILYLLQDRLEKRQEFDSRIQSPAYLHLSDEYAPLDLPCYRPESPLPRDLTPVIKSISKWKAKFLKLLPSREVTPPPSSSTDSEKKVQRKNTPGRRAKKKQSSKNRKKKKSQKRLK